MNPQININPMYHIKTKIKDSPDDNINITPILNYIRDISPENYNTTKDNLLSNKSFSPNKIKKALDNSSKVSKTVYDINNLTINHNTNLTNLNLYFLYNSDNKPEKNEIKKQNLNVVNKKEPIDSIRKKIFEKKNHPSDKDKKIFREKDYKKKPLNKSNSLYRMNIINHNYTLAKINEYSKTYRDRDKTNIKTIEPKGKLNLAEFTQINQIGKGSFGKIFAVKWAKNDKIYVLKKEIFNDIEFVEKRKKIVNIIDNFLEKTNNKGVIQIYSSLCKKAKQEYIYYELMELGEMDWEKEINLRRQKNLYYTENELINISSQLIKTLSLMQKYHITHRDIKPQNILIVNGKYKLCDFGEIRIMEREGIVVQRIRGSELYMSPILFYGLRANMIQVKHNTYKSDVFSLGMCIIYAATMYFNCTDEIREINDMKIIYNVLNKYLGERYSNKLISLIFIMIQIEEELRPDFIKLEENLNTLLSI